MPIGGGPLSGGPLKQKEAQPIPPETPESNMQTTKFLVLEAAISEISASAGDSVTDALQAIATLADSGGGGGGFFSDGTGANAAKGKGAGVAAGGDDAFAQGVGCVANGPGAFAQGQYVEAGLDSNSEGMFGHGLNVEVANAVNGSYGATPMAGHFAQGKGVYVGTYGYYHQALFGQGVSVNVGATSLADNCFGQGQSLSVHGTALMAQGLGFSITGNWSMAQGRNHTNVGGNAMFCQGDTHNMNGANNTAMFGAHGKPNSFGALVGISNGSTEGERQAFMKVMGRNSMNATGQNVDFIRVADTHRGYICDVLVQVHKQGTDDEWVTWESRNVLIYRNAAGAVVVAGTPTFTPTNDTGTIGACTVTWVTPTGNDVQIRVTGTGTGTFEWGMVAIVSEIHAN